MLEDKASIHAFLHFGYVPDPAVRPPAWLAPLAEGRYRPRAMDWMDLSSMVAEGMGILKRVFQDTLRPDATVHIVPLSGGLDSRAILGALLENLESRKIQTVTFGSPGMWDFEIGRDVARAAGVRWTAVDLSSDQWSWDTAALVRTAQQTGQAIGVFDAHVNRQVPERFGSEPAYWSGFMGNPLDGDHLFSRDSTTWDEARRRFVVHNRFSSSLDLAPPGFDAEWCLPPSPLFDNERLCYDEQLDFVIRQHGLVRHVVLPQGYEYRAPFLHPEWVRFILGAPRRYRQGRYLYKEILKAAYAPLFSLPVKANLGLPLQASRWRKRARFLHLGLRGLARRLAPNLCYNVPCGRNYMDFDHALRRRKDLRTVIGENLQDLKKRGTIDWMDMEDIWRRHQRGHGNHADALLLLASLEIHLKVQDEAVT